MLYIFLANSPFMSIILKTVNIFNCVDMSLLERLMTQLPMYQRQTPGQGTSKLPTDESEGEFNPSVITKLINSYRSHPDILKVGALQPNVKLSQVK